MESEQLASPHFQQGTLAIPKHSTMFACFVCKTYVLSHRLSGHEMTFPLCELQPTENIARFLYLLNHVRNWRQGHELHTIDAVAYQILTGSASERHQKLAREMGFTGNQREAVLWIASFASLYPCFVDCRAFLNPFGYDDPQLDLETIRHALARGEVRQRRNSTYHQSARGWSSLTPRPPWRLR